jgi:hypothetical protein
MRKLFRHHRGGLAESLATTVEVNDFADVERIVKEEWGNYCSNVNTVFAGDDSDRINEEWKETYYVVADFKGGHKQQCIGMCNFAKSNSAMTKKKLLEKLEGVPDDTEIRIVPDWANDFDYLPIEGVGFIEKHNLILIQPIYTK